VTQRVGIGWYTPWEWAKLRKAVSDPERLDDSYLAWRRSARQVLHQIREKSLDCKRVFVRVDELVAWCREQGRAVDGPARAAYVTELVRRRYGDPP
jgi:hypothetical protein